MAHLPKGLSTSATEFALLDYLTTLFQLNKLDGVEYVGDVTDYLKTMFNCVSYKTSNVWGREMLLG